MDTLKDIKEMSVDIIIPTYRPDHKFDLLMKRLKKQTIQPRHIFIINTIPNSLNTEEGRKTQTEYMHNYVQSDQISVTHIGQADFNHGATRAHGASMSNADFIMFMTQDAIPVDEYLIEELLRPFSEPTIGATYARQMALPNANEIETFTRTYNYPLNSRIKSKDDIPLLGIKTFFCSDVCAVYRKTAYDALGGFVKKTIFNEDMIFASKLIHNDYKVAYVAEAKVYHSHSYSYRQQFTRNFDLGVSHAQYPEVFGTIKSESEGIAMVKKAIKHLCKRHQYIKVIDLVFESGFKYLGYFFGKRYEKLPKNLVLKWTMNKGYWK